MSAQYSQDELLDQLRTCKERYGKCPPRLFDEDDNFVSSSTVVRRFGSWKEAKQEAGIDEDLSIETGRTKEYTDDQILSHIRECQQRNGKVTTQVLQSEEDLVSPTTVIERFDSWMEAKVKSGIDPDERVNNAKPREYTDEDYLEMLKQCEEKHGRVTQRIFNDDPEFCSAGAIRKRFGSWSTGKEKAGLETGSGRYTEEELIRMLQECQKKHGNCSAQRFASDEDFAAPETLQRRFGSWSNAKERAGVE